MRSRAAQLLAVVGALGAVFVALVLLAVPASADTVSDEATFVARINEARAAKGVAPVVVDVRLVTVARNWTATMVSDQTLHHNPNLSAQSPSTWRKIGENIGYGGSVASVADALFNSPGHYANMVDPAFNAVGVGILWSGGTVWVTEDFMEGPAITAATAAPVAAPTGDSWYRVAASGGEVRSFGAAGDVTQGVTGSVVGAVSTPSGGGYWLASSDGDVTAAGDAGDFGSMQGKGLSAPIVSLAATPTGKGYWLLGRDGGVFSFGDAKFFGSTGAMRLNQPIVTIAATPSGKGYWFVASDGGVFSFGDAQFLGSTGAITLNQPIVGMAATRRRKGLLARRA